MKRTIRLAVLFAVMVGLFAHTAHAALVRVDTRTVKGRVNDNNTSADTLYVMLDGDPDSTAVLDLYGTVRASGLGLFGGGGEVSVIPDSIFLTFEAIDVENGADDSLCTTVAVKFYNGDKIGPSVTIGTITKANAGASNLFGIGWSPRTYLGGTTGILPVGDKYIYVFDDTYVKNTTGGDSTKIINMTERRFLTY